MKDLLNEIKIGFITLLGLLIPIAAWVFLTRKVSYFIYYTFELSKYCYGTFISALVVILTIPIIVPICLKIIYSIGNKFD